MCLKTHILHVGNTGVQGKQDLLFTFIFLVTVKFQHYLFLSPHNIAMADVCLCYILLACSYGILCNCTNSTALSLSNTQKYGKTIYCRNDRKKEERASW
jgi:hypothetical protein